MNIVIYNILIYNILSYMQGICKLYANQINAYRQYGVCIYFEYSLHIGKHYESQ